MQDVDVLIVGGGPAGSSCARALAGAGADVAVLDRAAFPRDKTCAGWITPDVVRALDLNLDEYARGRTLQPFTGFAIGRLGERPATTRYDEPISYGIRRCEFDTFLLQRSGARVLPNAAVSSVRREGGAWIVNDAVRAPMLVGAGGHFCPVARAIDGQQTASDHVIAAQEIEVPLDPHGEDGGVDPAVPELYFWPDLAGYGWCVRKGDWLNIGAGRLGASAFPQAMREFVDSLTRIGRLRAAPARWKGHAYLLRRTSSRPVVGDGVLLAGDAAGLAFAPSGEGILAAIESGQLAGRTILEAQGRYDRTRLESYAEALRAHFGPPSDPSSRPLPPAWLRIAAGRVLLGSAWMRRHVILEDWFLHQGRALE